MLVARLLNKVAPLVAPTTSGVGGRPPPAFPSAARVGGGRPPGVIGFLLGLWLLRENEGVCGGLRVGGNAASIPSARLGQWVADKLFTPAGPWFALPQNEKAAQ